MDKSWIRLPRNQPQYIQGLEQFLDFAIANKSVEGRIKCPCPSCSFRFWLTREEVYDHLLLKQFPPSYTTWIWHGESIVGESSNSELHVDEPCTCQPSEDPIMNMINDAFGVPTQHVGDLSTS